jgi:phasin family protein
MRKTMLENFEDVQKISKANVEATTQAFGTLSKSSQAIATEMMEYSKRSYENSTKAMEKLFAVKSLDKAIEVQSEYAKSMFEDFSAQATKLGQLYTELTKEAFKPFEAQMAKVSPDK